MLLGLWSKGSESTESWKDVLEDLVRRGLRRPLLAILDGCGGLRAAVELVWTGLEVQRCLVHKLRNLLRHAPKHAHDEVRDDFHKIMDAKTEKEGREAYEAFLAKWKRQCASVAKSLEEAGEELLTFLRYPKSQWKSLRTTNVIERLNEEFRRWVKTQSSLPNESAILIHLTVFWPRASSASGRSTAPPRSGGSSKRRAKRPRDRNEFGNENETDTQNFHGRLDTTCPN